MPGACSPSRACCFTGRYGSLNGVSTVPGDGLNPGETTFVEPLSQAGYQTGYVGKWHLTRPKDPLDAGFDFASGDDPRQFRSDHNIMWIKITPGMGLLQPATHFAKQRCPRHE